MGGGRGARREGQTEEACEIGRFESRSERVVDLQEWGIRIQELKG